MTGPKGETETQAPADLLGNPKKDEEAPPLDPQIGDQVMYRTDRRTVDPRDAISLALVTGVHLDGTLSLLVAPAGSQSYPMAGIARDTPEKRGWTEMEDLA